MATKLEGSPRPAGTGSELQDLARRHLWMHFTRMGAYDSGHEVPVIVRGEGPYVYDEHGKRYLDGLSALFCVNAGHGRAELGEAAAAQAKELGFYTNWSYAHPRAIELAARIASLAPGRPQPRLLHLRWIGVGRVGAQAGPLTTTVCAARGPALKLIARELAYHGVTLGALRRPA